MSEHETIQKTPSPRTRESIANDLRQLGVEPGMTIIVHSSLKSLGWVSGGPETVVQVLMDAITSAGTIVMPTHSGQYSDPAKWQNPPVPEFWLPVLYETMPAFNPQVASTRGMGIIVDTFHTFPGVTRSYHPTASFAAWGQHAEFITTRHSLDDSLGDGSPLARIYDLKGWVLLLGVGYDRCTSLHLAEYRAPGSKLEMMGSPIYEDGRRVWKIYKDIEIDSDLFPTIGADLENASQVKIGPVGSAECRFFPQRSAVDYAVQWFTDYRAHQTL